MILTIVGRALKMIYWVILLSGAVAADNTEVCAEWEKHEVLNLRCKNTFYRYLCPDAYSKGCTSVNEQNPVEPTTKAPRYIPVDDRTTIAAANARKGTAPAKEVSPPYPSYTRSDGAPCRRADDPNICPKWGRQSVQAYCSNPRSSLNWHCCQLTKEKCRDYDRETATKTTLATRSNKSTNPAEETTTRRATTRRTTTIRATTTQPPKQTANGNFRSCCEANGVPKSCLSICTYNPTGTALCDPSLNCESYFIIANYCGNNNGDNSGCCQSKGIIPKCLKFCNSNSRFIDVSNVNDLLVHRPCLQNPTIRLQCAAGAYEQAGPQWRVRSFPEQGIFPKIAKNIAANRQPCRKRG